MIKVLFIHGLHGNEQATEYQIKDFVRKIKNSPLKSTVSIDVIGPISTSNSRTVEFNLNRMDEIARLKAYSKALQRLLDKIKEYDIILDCHNSPLCENLILYSTKNKINYMKPRKGICRFVWRKSDFITVSEHARQLGKVAFTVEIGGMYYTPNKENDSENFNFLNEVLKFSLAAYNRDVSSYDNLFNWDNKLRTIVLKESAYLYPGAYVKASDILRIDDMTNIKTIKKITSGKSIRVLAVGQNHTNTFEGVIGRKVKL